ncbi:(S)-2-hydroxy-acid oxidase [Streptomyces sp. NBRC 110611]|nr:(S)-2-hydroxy-acid oxidase [Streptomyces sp. NBRC 110611]
MAGLRHALNTLGGAGGRGGAERQRSGEMAREAIEVAGEGVGLDVDDGGRRRLMPMPGPVMPRSVKYLK